MSIHIPWNQHEVALLIDAYCRITEGADFNQTAVELSQTLRDLAQRNGQVIMKSYRNVNGIRMQLSNVWYLHTNGEHGLSGASSLIRQMYELKKDSPDDYQRILEEALSLIGHPTFAEATSAGSLSHETPEPNVRSVASKRKDIFSIGIAEDNLPLLEPRIMDSTYHREAEQPFEYVDLTTRSDCSFKNPVQVSYKDEVLKPVKTWKQVYIWVIQHLLRDYEETIRGLVSKPLTGRGLPDIRPREEANALRSVGLLSDDLVVEAGFSATDLMYRITLLMKSCGERAITVAFVRRNKDDEQVSNDQKTKPSESVIADYEDKLVGFERFLSAEQSLAGRTVTNYIAAMHTIESYSLARGFSVLSASPENIQQIVKSLLNRPDFAEKNIRRHNTYSAALGQYAHYLQMSLLLTYQNNTTMNNNISSVRNTIIPNILREYIKNHYSKGIRFDETVLRLIGERLGMIISEDVCKALQREMFKREDDLYFLDEMIADSDENMQIKAKTQRDIDTFGLCEVDVLYKCFAAERSNACIRDANDYADFLRHLLPDTIRIATVAQMKIIYRADVGKKDSINMLMNLIIEMISEKGSVTQDDLIEQYPVLSKKLLGRLLDRHSDEVIKTTINDIVCYQSVNSLGFDESFSETLNSVLERIGALDLQPNCEVIHTLLSIEYGQNFRDAYLIQDDQTLRRIITRYYTGKIPRAWKASCFTEE